MEGMQSNDINTISLAMQGAGKEYLIMLKGVIKLLSCL